MFLAVEYEKVKNDTIFIDVRSPIEYKNGTIEGAVNIPILTEEERALVGTAYKQISVEEARRLGIKFVSPKMLSIYDEIVKLKEDNKNLTVFCARGGYRSTFFANAFTSIGVKITKLQGGYKQYRKVVLKRLPEINEEITYIVVHGNTGVGKTEILHVMKEKGIDILDLEGAANHRGSLLGSIGLGECNSQKSFESKIYYQLDNAKFKYIFVEAESRRIGKVMVPPYIHEKMKKGIHIYIDADIDYRVSILKKDYILNDSWINESIQAIKKLSKYMSKEKVEKLIQEVKNKNFDYIAKELMLNYYDPMYQHKSNQYEYALSLNNIKSSEETADKIVEWYENSKRIFHT